VLFASTAVVACALGLLGKAGHSMPPIETVATPPADGSSSAEGFVLQGRRVIYVVTSAPAYRSASCDKPSSLIKLASVLVHEEWHLLHGPDERGAYEAQLFTLLRLGATTESFVYRGVLRSMQAVLKERAALDARRRAAIRSMPPRPTD
jgi:hypothetical protein